MNKESDGTRGRVEQEALFFKLHRGLIEQWGLIELFYRCQYRGRGHTLSTWRTPTGVEVDAVVETPNELVPIEIKWTDSPRSADARHVEKFIDAHSDKSSKGFVVCRTPHKQQLSARVTALPWDEF